MENKTDRICRNCEHFKPLGRGIYGLYGACDYEKTEIPNVNENNCCDFWEKIASKHLKSEGGNQAKYTECKYLEFCNLGAAGHFYICTNENNKYLKDRAWPDGCDGCVFYERDNDADCEAESKNNLIAHPNHYCDGRQYEPVKVIQDWGLSFCSGNAVKYIARAGRKPGNSRLQDLEKARQYIEFEIEEERSHG